MNLNKWLSLAPRERASEIIKRLKNEFPANKCALNFGSPFELLVATILSAQCTDKMVNIVTADLFRKYRRPEDYARADLKKFQEDIRSTGFYRNKAKNIIAMAGMIVDRFSGKVPEKMEDLVILPGVARKTANVLLGVAFGKNEGVVVDTHVGRITGRLGFTTEKTPVKIEQDLMKVVARKDWTDFSLLLIAHGRKICLARGPKCRACVLVDICPASKEFLNGQR